MPEEMFKQDLRPQVEKVSRLVEQEKVWRMKEQGREFHSGLPPARKVR